MAVDVAARPVRVSALAWLARVPAALALGSLVAAGTAARWLVGGWHATPYYFPDEYLYSALAEGIARDGLPSVHGIPAAFPALLQPLLTAAFWLPGDPGLALALTQGLNALAVSLAAVPAYLLARTVGAGKGLSLVVATLAAAVPGAVFASFVLADPIAYPLALTAVWLAVRVATEPSGRAQAAFLAVAGLAVLARVQYAVLALVLLAAVVAVDGRRGLRALRPTLAVLGVGAVAAAVAGLGYYRGVLEFDVRPTALLVWAGRDAMVLAYSAGWILVPGALAGLVLALVRPGSRAERAFGAATAALAALLVLQSALYETNAPSEAVAKVHERYFFVVAPLLALAFGLWARRGAPHRAPVALGALALLAVSARVPLSGYTVGQGKADSPTLRAVYELGEVVGIADASLVVAALAALLSLGAVAGAYRPRLGTPTVLAAALAASCAIGAGAYAFDRNASPEFMAAGLPADARWVDRSGLGSVSLLVLPRSEDSYAFLNLFWNRSVGRVLLLGAPELDPFGNERVAVAPDGRLLAADETVRSPLLVQTHGSQAIFDGAELVAAGPGMELLRPRGTPRLRLLAAGFYADGRLAPISALSAWGEPVTVRLAFHAQEQAVVTVGDRRIALRAGERRAVDVEVAGTLPVTVNGIVLAAIGRPEADASGRREAPTT
jgi:hypothetical protein